MKKIAIIIFLFSSTFLYSQTYTEKYNSINNRYEYYNSSGYMIGYKQWSSINNQWEYYSINNKRTKTDYGKYVQPVNLELANKALSSRQNSYDRNITRVSNHIEQLNANLFNYFSDDKNNRNNAMRRWSNGIQEFWTFNIDYSSTSKTQNAISLLNNSYYQFIDDFENIYRESNADYNINSVSREVNNVAPQNYIFKCRLKYNFGVNVKSEPHYKATRVTQVYKTNTIYVIEEDVRSNKNFDYIYVNGSYGYILGAELDKENKN